MVIEAESISCRYGEQQVISEFSTRIIRGDRIGIIGPNGAGKSTLLKILLKKASPDTGVVKHGTGLMVASFDQLRESLDEDKTVADNIGHGSQFITVDGKERHVISHLKDFLFSPQRCRTPVHILSGGEKNRLLLAKLFARPANVLVLDEPTNDLDIETLELLEEMLFHFKGTVLLVSHDRDFLNNVVTSTLVFEEPGRLVEYAGGYDDWLSQREKKPGKPQEKKPEKASAKARPSSKNPEKLSFREKQELESIYEKIDALETEHKELCTRLSDPDLYKKNGGEIAN
jgi:ABC transport system ATP-binding/permease protein